VEAARGGLARGRAAPQRATAALAPILARPRDGHLLLSAIAEADLRHYRRAALRFRAGVRARSLGWLFRWTRSPAAGPLDREQVTSRHE
jgi:hypothetical protein